MLRDKIDYADNTCTRDNTHAVLYSVGTPLVYGKEVVVLVNRIAHHLCRNELVAVEQCQLSPPHPVAVAGSRGELVAKCLHLFLQIDVALRKLTVHLYEREVGLNLRVPLVDLAHDSIGG